MLPNLPARIQGDEGWIMVTYVAQSECLVVRVGSWSMSLWRVWRNRPMVGV